MKKPNSKKTLFTLVVSVALIIAILTACAPTTSQTGPGGPAVEAPGEVQRIALEESKAVFEKGEATFVDVRSASSYEASHIPGALSIPLAELQSHVGELDPNQWIITYCT
jgi:3-mercaptopyruvate sulfurtransferase SseA